MEHKITVREFFEDNREKFKLKILAGEKALDKNEITVSDINRPGLALAGFYGYFPSERIQVFGGTEISYLTKLGKTKTGRVIENIFKRRICCAVLTRNHKPPYNFLASAEEHAVPTVSTSMQTTKFISAAMIYLEKKLAPKIMVPGTFIDVYGIGVMVIGSSGIGKSEIALELVKRGHRLVADDMVEVTRHADDTLAGRGPVQVQHHMEIRGVGVLDIKKLFGAGAVRDEQAMELIVHLEEWERGKDYERTGIEQHYEEMLGVKVPMIVLPMKSGRNISVIVEAAAMNQRLRNQGYNPALELDKNVQACLKTAMEKKNVPNR